MLFQRSRELCGVVRHILELASPRFLLTARTVLAEIGFSIGLFPLLAAYAVLIYGLHLLRAFQSQERIWVAALDARVQSRVVMPVPCPICFLVESPSDEAFFEQSFILLGFRRPCVSSGLITC
jgi:hypothetical protein